VALLVCAAAPIAKAQAQGTGQTTTTAPCGSGTPNACGFVIDIAFTLSEGQSRTEPNCNLQPGSTAVVNVNGAASDPITVNPQGCAPLQFTAVSDGIALGGLRLPLAAVGLQLAQNTAPQIRVGARTFTSRPLGTANLVIVQGPVPGPAGNVGRYNIRPTIIGPAAASTQGGALGRTGAMVLRWSLLGGALLAVGVLFVMASRRRRHADVV
jgi:hypothetical protein